MPVPAPVSGHLELTAVLPEEMVPVQQSLIDWGKRKIFELQAEAKDLHDAYEKSVKVKWRSEPLKKLYDKTIRRVEFYQKMVGALEHGFVIIPNFPVSVFAIRTDKTKPLKLMSGNFYDTHEQKAPGLPASEGEYKNPFPHCCQMEYAAPTKENPMRKLMSYWADSWKELEFPISMAKVKVMEATSQAMALKIFDDFGIMPERKKEDPIIVARLIDPRSTTYNRRYITFMIAWHLNTRDL